MMDATGSICDVTFRAAVDGAVQALGLDISQVEKQLIPWANTPRNQGGLAVDGNVDTAERDEEKGNSGGGTSLSYFLLQ
jgi:hypothetical protein